MNRAAWTQQQDDTLVKLWNEGKSANKIAEAMKVTRNAVIGRIHRLKAGGHEIKEHVQPPGRRRQRRLAKLASRSPDRVIRLVKPCKPPKALPDTLEGSVTLFERTGCKWPVTAGPPHRFCNRVELEGSSYCEVHALRSIAPPKQRALEAAE